MKATKPMKSTIIRVGHDYDLRVHWARLFFSAAANFVDEAATAKDLPPRDRFRRLAALFRGIAKDGAQALLDGGSYTYIYEQDERGRLAIAVEVCRD